EKTAERIVPRQRGDGEDIRFPVKGGYPLFWLKRATVSSRPTEQGFSGDVNGEITDISTDPTIVPNPSLIRLEGDCPAQEITGFKFLATLDHRTDAPKQTVEASVASFPVTNVHLSDGSHAKL